MIIKTTDYYTLFQKKLFKIGTQLVNCRLNCKGICNNPKKGIIPRCLYLEYQNRNDQTGCVVVGINPGRSINNSHERKYYLNNQITYNTVISFWTDYVREKHRYYKDLRTFIECARYNGPILWTELVKCENEINIKFLPLQTFRTCIHNYLDHEINLVPQNWPIIAVGREAHKALSYLYPNKSILGIPHPNSRGHFHKMFNESKSQFIPDIQDKIRKFKKKDSPTIWLKVET